MRERFRYMMQTVGFRAGLATAGATWILAWLLIQFSYNPFGQFRLLLSVTTVAGMVWALRKFRRDHNNGQLNVTDGLVAGVGIGMLNATAYSVVVWMWTMNDAVWQLYVQGLLEELDQGRATIVKYYDEQQPELLRNGIFETTPSFLASFLWVTRFFWSVFTAFLVSLYYRTS
ncbi:MAG: DUF4199 domain-containing protein [Sphingomonadales bacterium]|nr:DUF4199 domain-containing protein [Sphingomonadales bacterium]